jgi:hypothetical protein
MAKKIMAIHNVEDGTQIQREMTTEELAQYAADAAHFASKQDDLNAKAEAKAALLERLGITAEEAALLLA